MLITLSCTHLVGMPRVGGLKQQDVGSGFHHDLNCSKLLKVFYLSYRKCLIGKIKYLEYLLDGNVSVVGAVPVPPAEVHPELQD